MKELTGKEHKQLLDALVSAFPTTNTLDQMVQIELSENINAIAAGGSLVDVTFNLIRWAEAHGRLDELVRGAANANPGNVSLQEFIRDVWDAQAPRAAPSIGTPARSRYGVSSQPSLKELKRQALLDRRANLVQDYNAVNQQIDQVLSDLDQQRLRRQLEALERNIAQIDADLAGLD